MSECRKKDIDKMKGKGKNKGLGKGKNPLQQQKLYGKGKSGYGNDWTWNDPWASSWKGKSGVHSVEEQYAWQSGDGTTLCELEVWTPTIEEAQNKGETVQSEKVECMTTETPASDDQKAWKCATTTDSEGKIESRNL